MSMLKTLLPIALLPLCFAHLAKSDDNIPSLAFAFGWLNDNDTFVAGDVATIQVIVIGNYNARKTNYSFSPNVTVNNKMGNSSFVSGVACNFGGDVSTWTITFVPIMVGLLHVLIVDDNFHVFDSSLHFHVNPGRLYPSAGVVSWKGQTNEFVAGTLATILILPKDAFGNNVTASSEGTNVSSYSLSVSFMNGSLAGLLNVTNKGWNEYGYVQIEFIPVTAGSLLLDVKEANQTLIGSPLMFKVIPGMLDVPSCVPQWKAATSFFQLFSTMETHIHQRDKYGNLVPGFYSFDIEVIEKGTNLSMPVADLRFSEVVPGIQLCSFSLAEPGNFTLLITDREQINLISQVPYDFTVYVGYCSGSHSIINGSGLNDSVAGEVSKFSVFLRDSYQYPSPIELEWLQIQILRENDTQYVWSSINPKDFVNGMKYEDFLFSFDYNLNVKASEFEIIYKPEKSGRYHIHLFCGNVHLNSGYPIKKVVHAGEVNTSISGVVKYAPRVPMLINNEIVVKLMDSFSNPVVSNQSKLNLEVSSTNKSEPSISEFVNNNDGSYTVLYMPKGIGNYEICVTFHGIHFLPCPFGVRVYSVDYFPKAENDLVSVWEDESIAFSTLENDRFGGNNASIVQYTQPSHGSVLQYGHLFRYTPYKGFNGNDSFSYAISDGNGNNASANVNISVLSIPPQFVSVPSLLQATEDMISPTFGGFSGLKIIYSDLAEKISVRLSAHFGTVFLSPMVMQFWQPMWAELSVSKGVEKAKELILEGRLEVINYALQFVQYFGDENFYGDDVMRVSTVNRNGMNHIEVPILVEPINDPPSIYAPEFIIFKEKKSDEEVLIFDRERDKFNFSVWDPDLIFPGNDTHVLVMFSVEVNSGSISTNLPAELIVTTELKLMGSYQWQPLQTFVTISKHFKVKAKGIRFRGTVQECNSVMQQLSYHGGEHDNVLKITVNDMGKYGCFPDCSEMMSKPLFAEAIVMLRRGRLMSSVAAHSLGSAIMFEFIALFSLGMVLMLFTCKCALVLVRERKGRQIDQAQNVELSGIQHAFKETICADSSEDTSHFIGCCSSSPLFSRSRRNFRQQDGNVNKGSSSLSQSSSDQHKEIPSGLLSVAAGDGQNNLHNNKT
ncbi:hypothetical protein ACET3Z_024366 [Daucus carota]